MNPRVKSVVPNIMSQLRVQKSAGIAVMKMVMNIL